MIIKWNVIFSLAKDWRWDEWTREGTRRHKKRRHKKRRHKKHETQKTRDTETTLGRAEKMEDYKSQPENTIAKSFQRNIRQELVILSSTIRALAWDLGSASDWGWLSGWCWSSGMLIASLHFLTVSSPTLWEGDLLPLLDLLDLVDLTDLEDLFDLVDAVDLVELTDLCLHDQLESEKNWRMIATFKKYTNFNFIW